MFKRFLWKRLVCLLVLTISAAFLNMGTAALAANSDGFVFPVLGISQTDPKSNTIDPLKDGWKGNGVGWSGTGNYVGHLGQDYCLNSGCADSAGKPVYAASNGKVVLVYDNPNTDFGWPDGDNDDHGWGRLLIIEHTFPSGFNTDNAILPFNANSTQKNPQVVYSLYGHMKKDSILTRVSVGDTVVKGQQIAVIGTAGIDNKTDGSHLHFEIRTNSDHGWGYSHVINSAPNHYIVDSFIENNKAIEKALIKAPDSSTIYWLQNNKLYHVLNLEVINSMQSVGATGWGVSMVTTVAGFAGYAYAADFISTGISSNGLLLRVKNTQQIYVITDGKKEYIPSPSEFNSRGYDWNDIIDVSQSILDMFPLSQDPPSYSVGQDAPTEAISLAITTAYNGNSTILGLPTGVVKSVTSTLTGNHGCYQTFASGSLQYIVDGPYADQTFVLYGDFYSKWGQMGFANSQLGFPIGNRAASTSSFGTSGAYQTFEGGSLQLNGSVPFVVYGKVYEKWGQMGYAASSLGLPTGDRVNSRSGFGTSGYYQRFEGGSIQVVGDQAYGVFGAIYGEWGKHGYAGTSSAGDTFETGHITWAGFPTSDAYDANGGKRQNFEGGYIQTSGTAASFVSTTHPTNLTAMVQADKSVQLNWQNRIANARGISVYRTGSPTERIAVLGASDTSFVDTTAIDGHPYVYAVQAYNETAESPNSNTVNINMGPWPMYGADNQHTRRSSYSGATYNDIIWQYSNYVNFTTNPTIDRHGNLYLGAYYAYNYPVQYTYYLYKLTENGVLSPVLSSLYDRFDNSTAIYEDTSNGIKKLYVGTGGGYCTSNTFYTVDLNTGATARLQAWDYKSAPAISNDGIVYFGTSDDCYVIGGEVFAVDTIGGKLWEYKPSEIVNFETSPAIGLDGTIYIVGTNNTLYSISKDGNLLWKFLGPNSSPAIGSDGTIYVTGTDRLYAIRPDKTIKWQYVASFISNLGIGTDDTIYISGNDGLYAIANNGILKWKYNGPTSSPAIDSNGRIFVASDNTLYSLIDDGTPNILWTKSVLGGDPIVGTKGRIYIKRGSYITALGYASALYGNIYDISTGNPISAASISISTGSVQSDVNGNYLFALDPGVYQITVSKSGYQTIQANIVVQENQKTKYDIGLTIPGPFNIVTTTLPPADTGNPYNKRVDIAGGSWPYTFSIVSGSMPPGISLEASTGNLTGIPTTPGSYTFVVAVSDVLGAYSDREFTIEVTPPLVFTTDEMLPRGTVGSYYADDIAIGGGTQPYTISTTSGTFPLDTFLNSAGQIRGKITDTVDFDTGVLNPVFWNTQGASIQSGALRISGKGNYAQFTHTSDGGTISFNWTKSERGTFDGFRFYLDGELPYNLYQSSATSGTRSVNVSAGTHTLRWVNGTSGSVPANNWLTVDNVYIHKDLRGAYPITAKVTDASGRTASKNFTLNVDGALVHTITRLSDGVTGTAYNQTLTATGGRGPYTWGIYSGQLPSGLSLDPNNGIISGNPSEAGKFIIVISVSDVDGRISYKDFTLNVASPITILTTSVPNGLKSELYSEAIRVTGGICPYTFTTSGQLPAGLTLSSSTGIISGTPTIAGYTTVSVTLTDSSWPTPRATTQNIGIRIVSVLTITSSAVLPNQKKGVAINPVVMVAKGGASPYTWALEQGYPPDGISLNPQTGELTGTPVDKGDFVFTLKVTDNNGATASKEFFWHVSDTLTITTGYVPDGAMNKPYSFTFAAKGGLQPYSWRVKSGTLPTGIAMSGTTGTIIGTPATKQTFSFTIEVSDNDSPSQTAEMTYIIEVVDTLSIYEKALAIGRFNQAYNTTIHSQLGTPPYSWRIADGTLPPGLSLTPSGITASIDGTPTAVGSYPFTLELGDSGTPAQHVTRVFTLEVLSNLQISTPALKTALRGVPYADSIAVTGGKPPYSCSLVSGSLPLGLIFNSSSGSITGTTNVAIGQSSVFTVRVTDSGSSSASVEKQLSIFVVDPLTVTTQSIQGGLQYIDYEATLTGQGGISPYTWSVVSGAFPAGLSINPTSGIISGIPATSGTFNFTVQIQDSAGVPNTAVKALSLTITANPAKKAVTLNFAGTGGGSVNSSPPGLECVGPSTCIAGFDLGTQIILIPTSDSNSLFSGWTGNCTGSSTCTLTMNADKTATASFSFVQPAKMSGNFYGNLQQAYNAATTNVTIQAREYTFNGNLILGRNLAIILEGGYNTRYNTQIGMSVLKGVLTVGKGSLVVENLAIK